ncbi:MAG: hypothetical protein GF364_15060 [Candidatus Lokiarchaeota archaeon]|nr:hypothetical protein [Candidatus Lokiarchaeota archaeon]
MKKATRKGQEEPRGAVCPVIGCNYVKTIKPLFFGVFGFRKQPKCPVHNKRLVFLDDLADHFGESLLSCIFDSKLLPPEVIAEKVPKNEVKTFVNGWIEAAFLARGLQTSGEILHSLIQAYYDNVYLKNMGNFRFRNKMERVKNEMAELSLKYGDFAKVVNEKYENLLNFKETKPLSPKAYDTIAVLCPVATEVIKEKENAEEKLSPKKTADLVLMARTAGKFEPRLKDYKEDEYPIEDIFNIYDWYYHAGQTEELTKDMIDEYINNFMKDGGKEMQSFTAERQNIGALAVADESNSKVGMGSGYYTYLTKAFNIFEPNRKPIFNNYDCPKCWNPLKKEVIIKGGKHIVRLKCEHKRCNYELEAFQDTWDRLQGVCNDVICQQNDTLHLTDPQELGKQIRITVKQIYGTANSYYDMLRTNRKNTGRYQIAELLRTTSDLIKARMQWKSKNADESTRKSLVQEGFEHLYGYYLNTLTLRTAIELVPQKKLQKIKRFVLRYAGYLSYLPQKVFKLNAFKQFADTSANLGRKFGIKGALKPYLDGLDETSTEQDFISTLNAINSYFMQGRPPVAFTRITVNDPGYSALESIYMHFNEIINASDKWSDIKSDFIEILPDVLDGFKKYCHFHAFNSSNTLVEREFYVCAYESLKNIEAITERNNNNVTVVSEMHPKIVGIITSIYHFLNNGSNALKIMQVDAEKQKSKDAIQDYINALDDNILQEIEAVADHLERSLSKKNMHSARFTRERHRVKSIRVVLKKIRAELSTFLSRLHTLEDVYPSSYQLLNIDPDTISEIEGAIEFCDNPLSQYLNYYTSVIPNFQNIINYIDLVLQSMGNSQDDLLKEYESMFNQIRVSLSNLNELFDIVKTKQLKTPKQDAKKQYYVYHVLKMLKSLHHNAYIPSEKILRAIHNPPGTMNFPSLGRLVLQDREINTSEVTFKEIASRSYYLTEHVYSRPRDQYKPPEDLILKTDTDFTVEHLQRYLVKCLREYQANINTYLKENTATHNYYKNVGQQIKKSGKGIKRAHEFYSTLSMRVNNYIDHNSGMDNELYTICSEIQELLVADSKSSKSTLSRNLRMVGDNEEYLQSLQLDTSMIDDYFNNTYAQYLPFYRKHPDNCPIPTYSGMSFDLSIDIGTQYRPYEIHMLETDHEYHLIFLCKIINETVPIDDFGDKLLVVAPYVKISKSDKKSRLLPLVDEIKEKGYEKPENGKTHYRFLVHNMYYGRAVDYIDGAKKLLAADLKDADTTSFLDYIDHIANNTKLSRRENSFTAFMDFLDIKPVQTKASKARFLFKIAYLYHAMQKTHITLPNEVCKSILTNAKKLESTLPDDLSRNDINTLIEDIKSLAEGDKLPEIEEKCLQLSMLLLEKSRAHGLTRLYKKIKRQMKGGRPQWYGICAFFIIKKLFAGGRGSLPAAIELAFMDQKITLPLLILRDGGRLDLAIKMKLTQSFTPYSQKNGYSIGRDPNVRGDDFQIIETAPLPFPYGIDTDGNDISANSEIIILNHKTWELKEYREDLNAEVKKLKQKLDDLELQTRSLRSDIASILGAEDFGIGGNLLFSNTNAYNAIRVKRQSAVLRKLLLLSSANEKRQHLHDYIAKLKYCRFRDAITDFNSDHDRKITRIVVEDNRSLQAGKLGKEINRQVAGWERSARTLIENYFKSQDILLIKGAAAYSSSRCSLCGSAVTKLYIRYDPSKNEFKEESHPGGNLVRCHYEKCPRNANIAELLDYLNDPGNQSDILNPAASDIRETYAMGKYGNYIDVNGLLHANWIDDKIKVILLVNGRDGNAAFNLARYLPGQPAIYRQLIITARSLRKYLKKINNAKDQDEREKFSDKLKKILDLSVKIVDESGKVTLDRIYRNMDKDKVNDQLTRIRTFMNRAKIYIQTLNESDKPTHLDNVIESPEDTFLYVSLGLGPPDSN